MQYLFYDTCTLLNELESIFKGEPFYISNLTLRELENIKTSAHKDEDTKYKARRLIHLLQDHANLVNIIDYNYKWDKYFKKYPILTDNTDSRIILTALWLSKKHSLIFLTQDSCCAQIAHSLGLTVQRQRETIPEYHGFKEVTFSDDELAKFYTYPTINTLGCLLNEYLIIKDPVNGEIIDKYKYTKEGFKKVPYYSFDSKMLGKIKPKDTYQHLIMDSLSTNKITMIRGSAGTGKSFLALGYLFEQLEKGKIDRIIVFCNTVATMGSAKLGFYPGTRDEKLLDSQIGNFLASKLGDKIIVEQLIQEGKLILLPMCDIRGYDTTGMKAGIYITEAQNLDIELMKLALQRIGEDSICILDGDSETQVDMSQYAGRNNGLRRVAQVFKDDEIFGTITLQHIYRSHIAELAEKL